MNREREPWFSASRWLRRFHVRAHHFGGGEFSLLLTHWLYFTNHAYAGERRFWIRVGEWRKSFGPRKPENSQPKPQP